MRLGLGSFACAWQIGVPGFPRPQRPMDAIGLLEFARSLGVDLVQIADNLPLHTLTDAQLGDVRDAAHDLRIDIELGVRGSSREHLLRYLEIAQEFGSKLVRVVIDSAGDEPCVELTRSRLLAVAGAFEAAGCVLAVENHDRFPVRVLAGLIGSVQSRNVGVCLDTANSLALGESIVEVTAQLAPFTRNVHLKDFHIERKPHMMGFDVYGAIAGEGLLDIRWLLQKIREHGLDPNIILELWPPAGVDPERAAVHEPLWVRESVANLQRMLA